MSDGSYELVFQSSGKCLDVPAGATGNGVALQQWDCLGSANQHFTPVPAVGGVTLVAKSSGKCIDVPYASSDNGTKLWQWDCHGGPNQVFNWARSSIAFDWTVPGASAVEIREGSPGGPIVATGTSGIYGPGAEARSGTTYFIQDASHGDATSQENTVGFRRIWPFTKNDWRGTLPHPPGYDDPVAESAITRAYVKNCRNLFKHRYGSGHAKVTIDEMIPYSCNGYHDTDTRAAYQVEENDSDSGVTVTLPIAFSYHGKAENYAATMAHEGQALLLVQEFFSNIGITLQLAASFPDDSSRGTPGTIVNYPAKNPNPIFGMSLISSVTLQDEGDRSDASHWNVLGDFGFEQGLPSASTMMAHEIMHLLGAPDRYVDSTGQACTYKASTTHINNLMNEGESGAAELGNPFKYTYLDVVEAANLLFPACGDGGAGPPGGGGTGVGVPEPPTYSSCPPEMNGDC